MCVLCQCAEMLLSHFHEKQLFCLRITSIFSYFNNLTSSLWDSLLRRMEAARCKASWCSSVTSTWAVEVTSGQVLSDTRTCRWYEPGGVASLILS